jgi:transposase
VPKSPGTGTHTCVHCGYLENRDLNVAKNILRLGCSLRSVTLPVAACSEKPLLKQGSHHQTCQRVGVTLRATE